MIEKILWTEIGIGQPASLAEGVVANGSSVVIVAPAALHSQWRFELERAGLRQPEAVTLMSPQALHKKGFPESAALIIIDDQFPESWKLIGDQVRPLWAQERPVWVRIDRDSVRYLLLSSAVSGEDWRVRGGNRENGRDGAASAQYRAGSRVG